MSAPMQQMTENLAMTLQSLEAENEGRTNKKEHTYCFMCARTYFSRILERCVYCASNSVQHYTSRELNLMGHRCGYAL